MPANLRAGELTDAPLGPPAVQNSITRACDLLSGCNYYQDYAATMGLAMHRSSFLSPLSLGQVDHLGRCLKWK